MGGQYTISNFSGKVKPGVVAEQALRDAKRGKDMSVYGIHVKAAHVAAKLVPQKLAMEVWLRMQNGGKKKS